MLKAIRVRTGLLILVSWALVNVLLYYYIGSYEAANKTDNRTLSRWAASLFKASEIQKSDSEDREDFSLAYRLMSPASVKPAAKYPLLVFLHGAGAKGNDNEAQLSGLPEQMAESRWRKGFPCFLLAPQCPENSCWTNLDDKLIALIRDIMAQEPVDPARVYLTGLSMGGYGSWALAAKEPSIFAAVIPICGGGDSTTASRLIDVPIWAVHGDADDSVFVEESRKMIAAIREAGGQPNYTELKGVGHDSWTQTYRNANGVLKWMFEQRKRHLADRSRQRVTEASGTF